MILRKPENILSVLLNNNKFYNYIDFIQDRYIWVSKTWRELSEKIIVNALTKAKFSEEIRKISQTYGAEAGQVVDELNDLDFDNPYLDEFEEEWFDQTERLN